MLPFTPEPPETLCARFPHALATVYDPQLVLAGDQTAPGLNRLHVFDFTNGIRMMASVEVHRQPQERFFLHFSFGVGQPQVCPLYNDRTLRDEAVRILKAFTPPDSHPAQEEQTDRAFHLWYLLAHRPNPTV